MTSFPEFSRVTGGYRLDALRLELERITRQLAEREAEISSGRRVRRPSDDPLAAARILDNQARIERSDQYLRNINQAQGFLGAADSALDNLGDVLIRAREIALSQLGSTANADTRQAAAYEVQNLLDQAIATANQTFGDRYIFGGYRTGERPFEAVGTYVSFRGDGAEPQVRISDGMTIGVGLDATRVFGAMSDEIRSRADLDPALLDSTKLADLNGGAGVRLGVVEILDGSGVSVRVDLAGAETVGDVIDRLNSSGFVTASINGSLDGLEIARAGADLTVREVDGGFAARDLGILQSRAGPVLTGTDVDPRLRETTPLAALRSGAGIDPSGLLITNGTFTATVDLSQADTVGDLLSLVESSGAQVRAFINDAGRGIDVFSVLSGAELALAENGGTTTSDLGLVIPFEEVPLERLNRGIGVGEVFGADLRIVLHDGTEIDIDISGARTVGDVLDLINGHPSNPGTLAASAVAGQERIQLVDSSAGPGDFRAESLNGSTTAQALGIAQMVTNPAGTITGSDLDPAGIRPEGLLSALIAMRDALLANDPDRLGAATSILDEAEERLLNARADAGGRLVRLDMARTRLEGEKLEITGILSEDRDADIAEAILGLQEAENVLQAVLAVASRTLSTSILDFLS